MIRMVGRSEVFAGVVNQLALAAPLDVPVLLTGKAGTGKSLLARAIHESGPRAECPFVEFRCAPGPGALFAREFLGAAADEPATRQKGGAVAAAAGGTLVLDGVHKLTYPAQLELVRFLESKQYRQLGAVQAARTDVRVIASTREDVEEAVSKEWLREDLVYLLSVVSIRMPGLQERKEDLPELAAFFLDEICQRRGLPRLSLPPAAIPSLRAMRWRGHVRQLANALEEAAIRAAADHVTEIPLRYLQTAVFLAGADETGRRFDEIILDMDMQMGVI